MEGEKKIKIMQQALDPTGYGGVSVEFRALNNSNLGDEYELISLILEDYHRGLSLKDILFYYRKIRDAKPDIIQIRGASIDGLNAELGAKLASRTKVLLCVHGMYSDFVYYNPIKRWIARYIVEPLCFMLADGISCVYKECSGRKNFKSYKRKMMPFVYNRMPDYSKGDVVTDRNIVRKNYDIPMDAIVGIFCGRITKEKGLSYLLKAFILLKNDWINSLHFLIVGDGSYYEEFRASVKIFPLLEQRVHFCGSQQDVAPMLTASDFFIMPSLHENHSIALLEAISMNLPCIVTDVGGNKEIIKNNMFGLVIKPFDAEEIEDAIVTMCDESIRYKFVSNIKTYDFKEFSNAAVDNQLRTVYTKMLGS